MEDVQAASLSQTVTNEQIASSQQYIKDPITCKEQMLSELQEKAQSMSDLPRRSERVKVQTERMLTYRKEELSQKERRLTTLYEQWKMQVRETREKLKTDITDEEMSELADIMEQRKNNILMFYSEMRNQVAPPSDIRRKIDACEAVSHEVVRIILEGISGVDGDFDAERERTRLRGLLQRDYALSIYGSTAASNHSQRSSASQLTAKRAEAAAELAAKEAEYEVVLEEQRQRERIKALEEEHKEQMAAQNSELERLRAQKEVKAARARLEAYDTELSLVGDEQSIKGEPVSPNFTPKQPTPALPFIPVQTAHSDVSELAQAVQDSIKMNKLPTPEPTVFSGDPINFIEWKSTFMSLIERKGLSAADKMYYLRRYVTGSARNVLKELSSETMKKHTKMLGIN
ncbi:uncharacterized protein LOC114803149 [Denticeps clupeoides]|uniref:uncharacterized protein LOC114803149 n=1 Tax=Denticeps clupeoides TaxID=299321 RepID=UPI0010A4D7F5|nr:uncharacterized protein LOC114803149 [Denticeps clupeoides]